MSFIDSIILGIIEGFTEFLPISSTAHLILASKLLRLESSEFLKTFEISVQLGAIASVVFLYWKDLISDKDLIQKIIVAFIPTAIIGFIFYDIVKDVFLENPLISVWALIIAGLGLILFEFFYKEKSQDNQHNQISYNQSLIIGLFQSIAIIPGVSRAAATILGGLSLGINRKTIVEFSFLLAVPTMAGATGLNLLKSANHLSGTDFVNLGIGFIVSFVMAMISIKFLLQFIQKHNFTVFGVYRILIGLLFLFLL